MQLNPISPQPQPTTLNPVLKRHYSFFRLIKQVFIYFYNQNFHHMLDVCISSILNQQLPILKEILLRFPFMLEIYRTFQQETFYEIISKINYRSINKNEGLPLDYKSFYLFFDGGYICKKGKEDKIEKGMRIKTKAKGINHNRINKSNGDLKPNRAYEVQQLQHFENISDYLNNIRPNESYYYSYKKTLVLYCCFQELPEYTVHKIKDLHIEKLKFIYSFPIFKTLQKSILEEHLSKFHFNFFKFNSFWQKQAKNEILFIKEGSVELVYNNGLFAPHVIDGKCIIGLDDPKDISVKVISQNVHCFTISQTNIHTILSKSNRLKKQPSCQPQKHYYNSSTMTPNNQVKQNMQDNLLNTFRATTSLKKRQNYRSQGQLDLLLKRQKRVNLRKHFSNFYNEIFEQFSEKKVRHMGLDINSDEKLVLYEIKLLQKKSPNMDQINNKLRNIRLSKMKKCKQAIQGYHHLKQLKNVGVTIT